jgi:uncharacterized protein
MSDPVSRAAPIRRGFGRDGHIPILFATGEETICGMLNKPLLLAPFWRCYFNTGAIDMASEHVTAGGGRIGNGPLDVPGGQVDRSLYRSAGAVFALPGSPPTG